MSALTEDQIRSIAYDLLLIHNSEFEFDLVYEHDDAEQWSESEQSAILDAMYQANINISWD